MACIVMIWYLSFCNVPETGVEDVPFIDKWAHVAMYGLTASVIWMEYLIRHTKVDMKKMMALAVALLIIMSGIIELLQEYCTGGRRGGDWYDLLANTLGVMLAGVVGFVYAKGKGKV
ncbi:MAG: VanZ family protein [Prevotella sp.]